MYFNRYNMSWIACLGMLFFVSYGSVNHLTAYLDTLRPISHYVFDWEKFIPFLPVFIYPYMSIDLLYALAFFIIPKNRYSNEKYKLIIRGLGLQLLINQGFSLLSFLSFPLKFSFSKPDIPEQYASLFNALLSFDLPYNQSPSLHISLMVILMVFYSQHISNVAGRMLLNIWFILIGLSVLFTYQHHIIDLFMGLFWGIAVVLMFSYSPANIISHHSNLLSQKTSIYKKYLGGLIIGCIILFILPILHNFHIITFTIPKNLYIILWLSFISALTVFKLMFYSNNFNIRKTNGHFTYGFHAIGFFYLQIRQLFTYLLNFYPKNINVIPNLSIGSFMSVKHIKNELPDNVIIINLAWECNNFHPNTINYPLIDLVNPNKEQIIPIIDHMHKLIHQHHLYVHCALGMFRTIFVTGAYLVKYEKKLPEEIIDYFLSLPIEPKLKQYLDKNRVRYENLYQKIKD